MKRCLDAACNSVSQSAVSKAIFTAAFGDDCKANTDTDGIVYGSDTNGRLAATDKIGARTLLTATAKASMEQMAVAEE